MPRPIKTIDQFEQAEIAAEELTDQELEALIRDYGEAETALHSAGSMMQGEQALLTLDGALDSLEEGLNYLLEEKAKRLPRK